jgi:hypothetical protein
MFGLCYRNSKISVRLEAGFLILFSSISGPKGCEVKWIASCWFVPPAPKSCCESMKPRNDVCVVISCYGIRYYAHRTASHFVPPYAIERVALPSCQNIFFRTVHQYHWADGDTARVFNPAPSRTTLRGGSHFVREMWFGFILHNGGWALAFSPWCNENHTESWNRT